MPSHPCTCLMRAESRLGADNACIPARGPRDSRPAYVKHRALLTPSRSRHLLFSGQAPQSRTQCDSCAGLVPKVPLLRARSKAESGKSLRDAADIRAVPEYKKTAVGDSPTDSRSHHLLLSRTGQQRTLYRQVDFEPHSVHQEIDHWLKVPHDAPLSVERIALTRTWASGAGLTIREHPRPSLSYTSFSSSAHVRPDHGYSQPQPAPTHMSYA